MESSTAVCPPGCHWTTSAAWLTFAWALFPGMHEESYHIPSGYSRLPTSTMHTVCLPVDHPPVNSDKMLESHGLITSAAPSRRSRQATHHTL